MVINQRVEQGIYVVLILSLEKEHRPLRSTELSEILSVSDSYLKKILRKLVLAGIISSNPGKDGGFRSAKSIEKVSIYDIYCALEGKECEIKASGIGDRIFVSGKEVSKGVKKVTSIFEKANKAFLNELKKMNLSELVSKKYYSKGAVDFRSNIGK